MLHESHVPIVLWGMDWRGTLVGVCEFRRGRRLTSPEALTLLLFANSLPRHAATDASLMCKGLGIEQMETVLALLLAAAVSQGPDPWHNALALGRPAS